MDPRSLHSTGGWEQRRPCITGSLWTGGASGSAILSLTVFKRNAGFGQAVVKILADRGITEDDATQVSEVFHCVQVGANDADVRRTVFYTWRGLVQHLSSD